MDKVRTGKGDPAIYQGRNFLYLDGFLAGMQPSPVEQQIYPNLVNPERTVGTNNFEKAKASQYTYYISQTDQTINRNAFVGFEENLQRAVDEWSKTTRQAKFLLFTRQGLLDSWAEDV